MHREGCPARTMCGCIPEECELPTVDSEYRREHETRRYGACKRGSVKACNKDVELGGRAENGLKPAERPAEASGTGEASGTIGGTASAGTGTGAGDAFDRLRYGGGEE